MKISSFERLSRWEVLAFKEKKSMCFEFESFVLINSVSYPFKFKARMFDRWRFGKVLGHKIIANQNGGTLPGTNISYPL